ncbi:MAG: hypothetical protein MR675_01510 [Lachnospira sp.]|nr:hypothetical protein [Lachnospira sp.]MDD5828300.1 hypothetical protein [Lachnospira sp.]
MSKKEQLLQLIEKVPDYKIGYILAFVEGITADEDADDAYCESLYQDYLREDDKEESYSLEDCKKEWGLDNV